MQEETKREKTLRIIKICAVILLIMLVLCGLLTGLTSLLYSRIRFTLIARRDGYAWHAENLVSENLEALQIPQEGTVIVTGECDFYSYMLVYADDRIEEDVFLLGNKASKKHEYWTVKITDGKTVGAWCAEHPLSEAELQTYTEYMQYGQCRFVTIFTPIRFFSEGYVDDSEMIGYYAPKHTE